MEELLYRLKLDKDSQTPMYQQLGDLICTLAEEGSICPNEKLPPIRKLASMLGVNNVTVVNAYKYLENKQVVYSIGGSGTYVSELALEDKPVISNNFLNKQLNVNAHAFDLSQIINFASGSVSSDLFPVDEFKQLFNTVLERDKGNAFGYEQIQGFYPLREEICKYALSFGIKSTPDRIQIISGAQQGIDLIAKAILSPGDVVLVENPTYYGASGAFLSRGAKLVNVEMEEDGININRLTALVKAYRPKLVYVMPYFQTPTCVNLSLEKKRKLLELSNKYNFYIIEEDNQSDFNFTDEEITPLKALDYKNRVIFIKSFSKILMPGLRLGFIILPKAVLERVLTAKYTTDIETSGFIQRAFHLFINSGDWDKHISQMVGMFRNRYYKMAFVANKYLKNRLEFAVPSGGLNFWFKLPGGMLSSDFCNMLVKEGVIVYPGSIFSPDGSDVPYIRLSFANVEEQMIDEGVSKIRKVIDSLL